MRWVEERVEIGGWREWRARRKEGEAELSPTQPLVPACRATAVNQRFAESLCTHCPPPSVHFLRQGSFPTRLLWAGSCQYW